MGYLGVFLMMALESTIVPVPSEIIMPPAGYWAQQGQMSLIGVILAGGFGSTFGSTLCYWFSRTLGRAVLLRYGKWILLPPDRLELAERWLADYALGGVFLARLLPVVRHLIGFPAGLVRMPFVRFTIVTFIGSTLWCAILAIFGAQTIGKQPDLINDPDALIHTVKDNLFWFVLLVVGLGAGWMFVQWFGRSPEKRPKSEVQSPEGASPRCPAGADGSGYSCGRSTIRSSVFRLRTSSSYAPISCRIMSAMLALNKSTCCWSEASTITRASGSVPEKRTSTRPYPANADSARWISCFTDGISSSPFFSRTRTFTSFCGYT
jgi:membrane protein DedA with SNARE-associated domain